MSLAALNLIVDSVSGAGAIIAIGIAVRAQRDATKARRAVTAERRRQFELEILRELLREIDETEIVAIAIDKPAVLARYRHRLALLPADELMFWRRAMTMNWRDDLVAELGHKDRIHEVNVAAFTVLSAIPTTEDQVEQAAQLQEVQRAFEADVSGRLVGDLMTAISKRVDAKAE